MNTLGLYIDQHGRVNHNRIALCTDEEVLQVAQLHGMPLTHAIGHEIAHRGIHSEWRQLCEIEKCVPNN